MIVAIRERFTEAVEQEAAARYGIVELKKFGGFESFVYEFEQDGKGHILKITHTIRRSEAYIMGELDWLNYLADKGVAVARAVPSPNGRLIERIEDGDGAWLVIAYEKAPGHGPTAEDWDGPLFEEWGRVIGQTHRLTQSYQLSNTAYKRQEWHEEEQLKARKYLPESEAAVIAVADELMAKIHGLPKPQDAFGMLHTDPHNRNFFVDGDGRVTLFDFDDCHYNWFAHDFAIILLGAVWGPPKRVEEAELVPYAVHLFTHFFRGYAKENRLDPAWLQHVTDFMLLRDLLNFVIVYQALDVANFNAEQTAMLDEHRARILERRPLVELDWTQFAKELA